MLVLSALVLKNPECRSLTIVQFFQITMAQGQKMCIFRTPPSLQITNFCMILSTPGGEPSVGSVSEVNHDRFSVGREWRALESVGEEVGGGQWKHLVGALTATEAGSRPVQ